MMVYVSNAESHEISVLDLNGQDGRSRLIETVATRGSVMSLAIDPGRKCLYAALRSKPHSLSSWAIHPDTGRLTPMSTVPAADDMAYLSTDRSGRYLFGASYFGDKISVNAIGAQGEISAKPLHVIPTGYPWLIHRLTYRRTNHHNLHVRGYKEEGTTTTPFDMVFLNDMDRFHLAADVIERVGLGSAAAYAKQAILEKRIEHTAYIRRYGEDMPEIRDWKWTGA